jgi:thiamine biosynthesis lipoprotein ApbE
MKDSCSGFEGSSQIQTKSKQFCFRLDEVAPKDAAAMLSKVAAKVFRHHRHHFCYEQVLGTTMELTVIGTEKEAQKVCDVVLAEIDRLEQVYSRYKPESELNQFLLTPVGQAFRVSYDFRYLLEQS